MKKFSVFILFAFVVGMISCKQDAKESVTKNGYSYTLFKTGSGDLIQVNDLVNFDMEIKYKDSVFEFSKSGFVLPA
jgi:hypothetical protein